MAKKKDSKSKASAPARNQIKDTGGAAQDVARTSARSTVSGPAAKNGYQDVTDDATAKVAGTEAMAAAMPFNAAKPSEYGEASSEPAVGQSVDPPHPIVGASTLSESNASEKVGSGNPQMSFNPGNGPLDRVRVDSSRSRADDQPGRAGRATTKIRSRPGCAGRRCSKTSSCARRSRISTTSAFPSASCMRAAPAAHGYFECYEPLTKLTRASIFAEAGKRTPVFVRFSTVAGERGSTDTARDVRGFAVKFYTDEGNWDLVGNNIPVFFIQDAMKFPDLVHAVKPEPHHAMPQAASAHDTFWDFVSLMPESTHMLMWVMSDRAIPRSYRMMQGFGVHTFRFVNAQGESRFVKFHWNPVAGTHSLAWDEAVKISGADPDFHRRDLWEAIEAGAYPEWELAVQIFSERGRGEVSASTCSTRPRSFRKSSCR